MRTARANLLESPNGRFVIGEYPIPDPAPGAVLMRIELCRICGTDVHTWHASAADVGLECPISLGHEISGTVGTPGAFRECLGFVRNNGTVVEVGNFVGSGTIDFSPCQDLLVKGITIIDSFDNEAEHFVRSLSLCCRGRRPA